MKLIQTVDPPDPNPAQTYSTTAHVEKEEDEEEERKRKKKLLELLQEPDLPSQERQEFLAGYHYVISLEDGKRGETNLV